MSGRAHCIVIGRLRELRVDHDLVLQRAHHCGVAGIGGVVAIGQLGIKRIDIAGVGIALARGERQHQRQRPKRQRQAACP